MSLSLSEFALVKAVCRGLVGAAAACCTVPHCRGHESLVPVAQTLLL